MNNDKTEYLLNEAMKHSTDALLSLSCDKNRVEIRFNLMIDYLENAKVEEESRNYFPRIDVPLATIDEIDSIIAAGKEIILKSKLQLSHEDVQGLQEYFIKLTWPITQRCEMKFRQNMGF